MDQALLDCLTLEAISLKEQNAFQLESFCFPQQLDFIRDKAHFKVAVCSRRAGKTVACAAHLIHESVTKQNRVSLYITLSRLNAKRIIWSELLRINHQFKLGGVINETELSIRFPATNSIIYLSGAKDKSEIEKFRGLAISLCYIDESQAFRSYVEELIDEVIGPALMDYGGDLCLIGTPGPIPSGYFHHCAVESTAWSRHRWTYWDNPFIALKSGQTHQALLERELTRRGVTVDDPSIQREWFGKWVLDSDSLLIHYDKEKNHYDALPVDNYNYILGIDLGFNDADALSVLAWSNSSRFIYLAHEDVVPGQDISTLVEKINGLTKLYDISKMVIDTGGLGKKIAEELSRRHGIPVQAADKARKMENVVFLNDYLRSGSFKAKASSRFAQDSYLVEIDRDTSTPDKIKVKDSYHSDIIDAVLYGFKASPAWAYQKPIEKPKYGTPAWMTQQVTEMEQAAEDHFRKLEEMAQIHGY